AGLAFLEKLRQLFSSSSVTGSAIGYKILRWPLAYTPPQSGNLVRVHLPDDGVLNKKFLVRWIGPNENPDSVTDAIFVFQTLPGTGAVEDEVAAAGKNVQWAQTKLENALREGRSQAATEARAELAIAQSQFDAARAKGFPRDEPLAEGIPIEVDN